MTDKTQPADFCCMVLNERKFLTPNGASSERKICLLQLGSTEFIGLYVWFKSQTGGVVDS